VPGAALAARLGLGSVGTDPAVVQPMPTVIFTHSPVAPSKYLRTLLILGTIITLGCKRTETPSSTDGSNTLVFGAYTTPREAYGNAILPAFRAHWKKQTGRDLSIRASYLASGAQSRAIVAGFEADVAALSLDPDIDKLSEAKLISHDWRSGRHGGIVTRSVVVIGVREGNPKNIQSWSDLGREGVEVLTPNVRTSGGAMWNVLAIHGAALREKENPSRESGRAIEVLAKILRNVKIMDRSGRDSMLTFERGVGDAIITYENEILIGQAGGKKYDLIIPSSTILIENPVAVVDQFATKHGTLELSRAFVDFLVTPESQRLYAQNGLRPVVDDVAAQFNEKFPRVNDLFTVRDLGGWDEVQETVFGPGGVYDKALEAASQGQP
jgi:sulfate/thiosulfate transport system substrate-binding protein